MYIHIKKLAIPVYGDKNKIFTLWNGKTLIAITERDGENFKNYIQKWNSHANRNHTK